MTANMPSEEFGDAELRAAYDAACAERDAFREALGYIDTSLGVHLMVTEDGEFDAAIRNTKRSIIALVARIASLEAAITSAISYANGRESEWGDRAEGAFAFLYAAMEPATGSGKERV